MLRQAGSYAATVMGFVIGTAGGGLLGMFLGNYIPNGGEIVGALAMLFLGGTIGAITCSILVSWGLLRACHYPAAGLTALVIALEWILLGGIAYSLTGKGDSVPWILIGAALGLACIARGIALALRRLLTDEPQG